MVLGGRPTDELEDDLPPERVITSDEIDRLQRGRHLGWLLFLLAGSGLAALTALILDERQRTVVDLAAARDEAAELRASLFRTEDRVLVAEKEREQQQKQASALATEAWTQQAARAQNEALIAQLRAQLGAKDGEVSSEANRVTVNLVDEILFPSGEADLSARGKEVLGRVGGVLKSLTDKQILIGGHTDDRPIKNERFPSNWELSAARAVNVVRHLAETVGVDPTRLAAAAHSQYHPRGKNKAKNRRIEILLTPVPSLVRGEQPPH